jgi:diaminopimelate epimerase
MRTSNVSLIGRYDTPPGAAVPRLIAVFFGLMRVDFTKMHGLGNDFIVLDAPMDDFQLSREQWRRLAARHTGIGFDQALVLEKPRRAGTAAYYRIYNADGAEVEQCGNGVRCIAALLESRGHLPPGEMALESIGGLVRARIAQRPLVSVDLGVPNFAPESLPFEARREAPSYRLDVADEEVEIGAVSLGNPHAVLSVASVDTAPVERLGPAIETHRRFPERVNVGFMQIIDRAHIRLRVYERGTGETLACGTGACAAVAVGRRRGLLDADVQVSVRGGELRVNWAGPGEHIWLTGPAEVSFVGYIEV